MAITDSALSTSVFTDIRTKIVAAAPYITNSTTSATEAASINAVYNDKTATRPQVVIYPIQYDEGSWKFNSTEGKKTINVNIECYHKTGLGADQLSDQVATALKANDIDGINLIAVTSDYTFVNPNEAKYHFKGMTFTYDRE